MRECVFVAEMTPGIGRAVDNFECERAVIERDALRPTHGVGGLAERFGNGAGATIDDRVAFPMLDLHAARLIVGKVAAVEREEKIGAIEIAGRRHDHCSLWRSEPCIWLADDELPLLFDLDHFG